MITYVLSFSFFVEVVVKCENLAKASKARFPFCALFNLWFPHGNDGNCFFEVCKVLMYNTYVLKSVKAIMICFLVDVKVSDINQGANDLRISEANSYCSRKSRLDLSASIFLKVRTYYVHVHYVVRYK